MGKVVFTIFVVLALTSVSKACFPSKYWISCLIDTCKLGGSCPGDPTATCRMDKTDCDGCKAVWVNKFGERANCSASRDLQLCPGGEPVVHCKVDPCTWPCDHPSFKNARCQKKYCGQCTAEYLVDGIWSQCPSTSPSDSGAMIPIDTVVNPGTLVGNCRMVPCSIEVCINQGCPAIKSAVCRPYACNECKPMWYLGNSPVDCKTGDFIQGLPQIQQPIVQPLGPNVSPFQRTCKPGESHVPCDFPTACDGQICRNYPNAVCRPDGCGTCKATWYIEDKLVDCLSDQCPPNVPFVRCVDDPCKYFSHYCPTAECRASQCGTCEAKFYVNGNEIDCVMPPKTCPVGVDAQACPWYTCPANICPSNSRLMCRINPCGTECTHEWVDIYNGESRTCRTFDKEQSPTKQASFKQPESNKIFFKDPIINMFDPNYMSDAPLYVDKTADQLKVKPTDIVATRIPRNSVPALHNMQPSAGEFLQQQPNAGGGFKVDPVFNNPGKPIKDADILSLLRSFPYEFSVVSSSAIKDALKKPVPKITPMAIGQVLDHTPQLPQTQHSVGGSMRAMGVPDGRVLGNIPSTIPQTNQNEVEPSPSIGLTKASIHLPPRAPVLQHNVMQQTVMQQMQQDFSPNLNTNMSPDTVSNTNMAPEMNPIQPEMPFMSVPRVPMPQPNLQTVQSRPEPRRSKTIELQPVSQPMEPMPQPMDRPMTQSMGNPIAQPMAGPMTQSMGNPIAQPMAPQPIDQQMMSAQSMETSIANTQTFDQAMALLRELTNKAGAAERGQAMSSALAAPSPPMVEQPPVEQQMQLMTRGIQTLSNVPANQGLTSDPTGMVQPQPKKVNNNPGSSSNGGLPISMNLFSQWGNMPL